MTKEDIDIIKESLDEIFKFDFDKYIVEMYPNIPLENVMFREYNAIEFKKIYSNVIKRFEALIDSDVAIMLPIYYYSDSSSFDITAVISYLRSEIGNSDKERFFDLIRYIFDYCIQFGNWSKKIVYKPSFSQEKIESVMQEITLAKSKLEQENEYLKGLIEEFLETKKDLDNRVSQTVGFYENIKNKSKNADVYNTDISSYLSSAEANKNTIETLKTNIVNSEQKISDNIENYRKRFEEVIAKNTESLSLFKQAEELQKKILSQKDTVETLIGAAADGSLGTHFKERKNQIQMNVITFIVLVIASLVATTIWVYMIFYGFDINNSDWVHFVINVLRTSPAWFLVWWLISRYSKERKLQEEYAFKSAIAMTMREHSKLLKNTDSGDVDKRDSQQIMLLKALENIYRNPDTRQDKEKDNLTPKNVEGFLSKLTELIKEFRFKN